MPELKRYIGLDRLSAKTTKADIDREKSEFLGRGLGEGTVNRVGVKLVGDQGKTRDVQMAEKVFDHPDHTEAEKADMVNYILHTHASLKDRGLPTIPTMRKDADNGSSIFMTDLTQNGKKDVVSLTDWWERGGRKGKFAETDYKIEIFNIEQFSESIADLFDKTIKNGCQLGHRDAFFIILDKSSKEAQIILGDLNLITIRELPLSSQQQQLLVEHNFSIFERFLSDLEGHLHGDSKVLMESLKKVRQTYLIKSEVMSG